MNELAVRETLNDFRKKPYHTRNIDIQKTLTMEQA